MAGLIIPGMSSAMRRSNASSRAAVSSLLRGCASAAAPGRILRTRTLRKSCGWAVAEPSSLGPASAIVTLLAKTVLRRYNPLN